MPATAGYYQLRKSKKLAINKQFIDFATHIASPMSVTLCSAENIAPLNALHAYAKQTPMSKNCTEVTLFK